MKRNFASFVALTIVALAAVALAIASMQTVEVVTVSSSFRLPQKEEVALTAEVARQHDYAVSFDEKNNFYLLEEKGWTVYYYSNKSLKTINLERSKSGVSLFRNWSLSVSRKGDYFWCSSADSQGDILRVYSNSGKMLQQWNIWNLDVGYVQAIDGKSAIVNGGGPLRVYTIAQSDPEIRRAQVIGGFGDYVNWNGVGWTIGQRGGPAPQSVISENLRSDSNGDNFLVHPTEPKEEVPNGRVFWHSSNNGIYARMPMFDQNKNKVIFFKVGKEGMERIAELKTKNDPQLQFLNDEVTLNVPLWGDENSVTVYAYGKPSDPRRNDGKQYILKFSNVPRWKTWFLQTP